LGLRELGTSGEKIPLLSTANTWSARQTFNGGITGALTGNADTATKLKTARTIGGVAFDGSANINLPGVNTTGNQNTTGNAATATKLATARTIGGVSFDGTANINLPGVNTAGNQSTTGNAATATKLQTARKISGVAFDGSADITLTAANVSAFARRATGTYADADGGVPWNAESGAYNVTRSGDTYILVNFYTGVGSCRTLQMKANCRNGGLFYRSSRDGYGFEEDWTQIYTKKDSIPGVNTTGNQNTTGNAATATKLQTARTIGGVSFDGTANINLPGVNVAGNQNTSGNAATATKLQTARTINGVSFDGSKNIELTAADLNLEQTVELAAGALQKNQNGADIPNKDKFTQTIGACRSFHGSISTGAGNWTTAQFIEWLESQWAFNHPYWMCKCSWSYGNNKIITDTGCGLIHLAGCVIEVMGNKGAMTIRVTTPSTSTGGGTTNAQFTYINHGDAYAPGWRRDYNTKNQQPAFALGKTGSTVGNDKAVGWNWNSGVYQANIGGASTLILHFNMSEGSCPAVQFRVNYKNGGIYYRSARDRYGFEADWSEFYTTTRKPSAGDVGAYTKAECNSRFITGIRLGTKSSVQTWNGPGWGDKSGYVVTASINSNGDELIDTTQARPVQYCINGTWYNAGSI
ncbi:tail fiber protein, partial [Escherichia coli]